MRTLNRPMFNMGGPIKQGIMHGIREPYRGGQLVRPGPGRPGYAGEGYFQNLYKAGKQYFNPFRKGRKLLKVAQKIPGAASAEKFLASLPQTVRQTFQTKGIPGSTTGQTFMKNLRDFSMTTPGWLKSAGTTAANWYARAPKKSLIGTAAVAPYVIEGAKKLPWGGLGDIITHPIKQWGKVLGIGEDEEKITDKDGVKSIQENIAWTPSGTGSTTPIITQSMQDKVAETKAQRQKNKMLEIMNYDESKKNAAYNALIDASQIIGAAPGGKSLDISKDIIQPLIAATSKRYQKPQDIKEAVGLLMAKGEIEKDIASGKGGTLKQNAKDLYNAGVFKSEAAAMKHLSSKKTMGGVVAEVSKQYGVSGANTDVLDTSLRIKEDIIPEGKWKGDNKVYKEFKNNNKDKANVELEFVKTITDRKVGDYYIVDKRIVLVDEDLNPDYYY